MLTMQARLTFRGPGRGAPAQPGTRAAPSAQDEGEPPVKLPFNIKVAARLFTAEAELATEEPMSAPSSLIQTDLFPRLVLRKEQ